MPNDSRWSPGAKVVWRSLPGGTVGTVLATFVIEDNPEAIVLFQPRGAPRRHRTGRRGGPSGRNMLPDGWDGAYEDTTLLGPSMVRLHPPGESYSVIRSWDESHQAMHGWYVNLEQPWIRTPIGFDSHDDVLDIRVSDDLSSWSWKDADELDWSVKVGKLTAGYARRVRETGEAVAAMIDEGVWPFQDAAWSRFSSLSHDTLPTIPHEWATTDWSSAVP